MYKVCILAAGKGTRNTAIEGLHKALLPVSNKAAISKILEVFPKNVPVVIALGYKSEQVKTYCELVHADRDIEFVEVENFSEPGSGPGLSLLQCKDKLLCPFVFTSADTILDTDSTLFENLKENWIGTYPVSSDESYKYCLVDVSKNREEKFYFKCNVDAQAFTGIAGIVDYESFWFGLSQKDLIKGEHQVTNGLRNIDDVDQKIIRWFDTGNMESYNKTKTRFPNDVVIEKNNEVIFIDNGWVVKYFASQKKLNDRVKRCEQLFNYSPKVIKVNDNMLAYRFIEGELLSDICDERKLSYFLTDYYSNFVRRSPVKDEVFIENCRSMYADKTLDRIEGFIGSPIDNIKSINGLCVEPIEKLLQKIDWEVFEKKAIPSCFHGDLQPENIIYSKAPMARFYYIDWRESFGNSIDVGDLHYDLGKLYHALVVSNSLILEGNYSVSINHKSSEAMIAFNVKSNLLTLKRIMEKFCKDKNIEFDHVRLIGILNYLNIASLYDNFKGGEYGRFLFLLGKKMLTEWLGEKNESI